MPGTTVYVPCDTTAVSLGADRVAQRLAQECRGQPVDIVRNGSRGAFWLEPMLEVEAGGERIAYGPVRPEDVPRLLEDGMLSGSTVSPLCLGVVDDIPFLKKQQRLTFARQGVVDPVSVASYRAHGGFAGLERALRMTPREIVHEIAESGLRGRGGAAFPTGIKWQAALDAPGEQKYVVCNADEGDSGTFADRMLMEGDPMSVVEGMIIAGLAVGANRGYVYLREEYPQARRILRQAIAALGAAGYLGQDICGSGRCFELELRIAAGSYVCGEETALLESLEGKRGVVRAKPPLPVIAGLFGRPTVVNNVISLATVPLILARGAHFYRDLGTGRSRGTQPFQLAGNIARGGLVELAFGTTLRELLFGFGGGTRTGRPMRAVQVGGPLGAYLPEAQWDTPMDYEAFAAIGATLGHGGIVAFDDSVNMREQARFAMAFCAEESCGKCTPCRIGSTRGVELIDRLAAGADTDADLLLLQDLCETMTDASLCALGGMTSYPVMSAVRHFRGDFNVSVASADSRETG